VTLAPVQKKRCFKFVSGSFDGRVACHGADLEKRPGKMDKMRQDDGQDARTLKMARQDGKGETSASSSRGFKLQRGLLCIKGLPDFFYC
jgi:hypothetical protein